MKVVSIGGGPAGLFSAILVKKAFADATIDVYERNRADDTFGFGVVFSDETLGHIEAADPESFAEIRASFRKWTDIETRFRGTWTVSTGHGFCGLSRRRLLQILKGRARELGVRVHEEREVAGPAAFPDADLILAADGVNSRIREEYAASFRPSIDLRRCKFSWLGTTKPLHAFTFVFKETPFGLFQVHAYPFEDGQATWIVECREETWRRAGLDRADEAATVAFCERIFAEELGGHPLLANRSVWRSFPNIACQHWVHGKTVLLGDAAHTAHYSIGSGTKLAMEDAMALATALVEVGGRDIPAALGLYESRRLPEVQRLQKVAKTSQEWFENAARYQDQDPIEFTFNLMTRSQRITFDNLRMRDPALVDSASEVLRQRAGAPRSSDGSVPAPAFLPFRLRSLTLANRIVVSPMCQYSATDGTPNDWHLVHLGSRAVGGAGLVLTEMTNVLPEGRITPGCAGLYQEEHVRAWRRIVEFVHTHSKARIGIQLAHAGRKGSVAHPFAGGPDVPLVQGGWTTCAPSAIPFAAGWPAPKAMDSGDFRRVLLAFVQATRWADEAGFDLVEIHMAHGYLLSQFLSPLSNRRHDEYGGTLENRLRFPLEVARAMRAVWPADKPLAARISATDWQDGGLTDEDAVAIARALGDAGVDLLDVSTGGVTPDGKPLYGRMYQVPFADRLRHEARIPVMAVGAIQNLDHVNTVLLAGRADLCALARPHLYDPYFTLHAQAVSGYPDAAWPEPYLAGRTPPPTPKTGA